MLRAGDLLRFTAAEIEEFGSLGIDFDGVRTQADAEAAFTLWASALSQERPDLLEKIVLEMGKAKGVSPPPRLTVVGPAPDCPGRS